MSWTEGATYAGKMQILGGAKAVPKPGGKDKKWEAAQGLGDTLTKAATGADGGAGTMVQEDKRYFVGEDSQGQTVHYANGTRIQRTGEWTGTLPVGALFLGMFAAIFDRENAFARAFLDFCDNVGRLFTGQTTYNVVLDLTPDQTRNVIAGSEYEHVDGTH